MFLPLWLFILLIVLSAWGLLAAILMIVIALAPADKYDCRDANRHSVLITDDQFELAKQVIDEVSNLKLPEPKREFKPKR